MGQIWPWTVVCQCLMWMKGDMIWTRLCLKGGPDRVYETACVVRNKLQANNLKVFVLCNW